MRWLRASPRACDRLTDEPDALCSPITQALPYLTDGQAYHARFDLVKATILTGTVDALKRAAVGATSGRDIIT